MLKTEISGSKLEQEYDTLEVEDGVNPVPKTDLNLLKAPGRKTSNSLR